LKLYKSLKQPQPQPVVAKMAKTPPPTPPKPKPVPKRRQLRRKASWSEEYETADERQTKRRRKLPTKTIKQRSTPLKERLRSNAEWISVEP
jgi:hypothetical protein